jgi:hypothetical protein
MRQAGAIVTFGSAAMACAVCAADRRPACGRSVLVKGSRFMKMERWCRRCSSLTAHSSSDKKDKRPCCLSLTLWLQASRLNLGFLRVFQYLTFRAVMAAMTALLIGLVAALG